MNVATPLLREHRLYQADWLLRVYEFEAKELLDEKHPNFKNSYTMTANKHIKETFERLTKEGKL